MGDSCDPGRTVNVQADETHRRLGGLTRVDAHPHPDHLAARPWVRRKGLLNLDCRGGAGSAVTAGGGGFWRGRVGGCRRRRGPFARYIFFPVCRG